MLTTRSANSLVASSRELASEATARTAIARSATKTSAELWYLREGASDMGNTVLGDDNTAVGSDRVERDSQRRFVSHLELVWIIRSNAVPEVPRLAPTTQACATASL